jgi:hypothetical protein
VTNSEDLTMRSSKADRHAALWQAGAITTLALTMTAFGIAGVRQPASATELRIPIEELQSGAAELALLCRERLAGQVTDSFYEAHLRHLARTQRDSYRELARLQVRPTLLPVKREAMDEGEQLARSLTMLRDGGTVDESELHRVRDRLDILAHGLRR